MPSPCYRNPPPSASGREVTGIRVYAIRWRSANCRPALPNILAGHYLESCTKSQSRGRPTAGSFHDERTINAQPGDSLNEATKPPSWRCYTTICIRRCLSYWLLDEGHQPLSPPISTLPAICRPVLISTRTRQRNPLAICVAGARFQPSWRPSIIVPIP